MDLSGNYKAGFAVSQKAGFTLLEVLVAMAVLAVALVSLVNLHNRNLQLAIRADRMSTATLLAQEIMTRTRLEGLRAQRETAGDFSEFYPDQYPHFRWQRTIQTTPLEGLWELRVRVVWGAGVDEACELTLFTSLTET